MENNFISSYLLRLNHNYKGLLVTISAIVTIAIGAITFYQFFLKHLKKYWLEWDINGQQKISKGQLNWGT